MTNLTSLLKINISSTLVRIENKKALYSKYTLRVVLLLIFEHTVVFIESFFCPTFHIKYGKGVFYSEIYVFFLIFFLQSTTNSKTFTIAFLFFNDLRMLCGYVYLVSNTYNIMAEMYRFIWIKF